MTNKLVSVIMPTYNRAHLIGQTLDSVLAQTYPNWECIIVDDGSTDTSDEVVGEYVKKDSRFQYYQRPKDRKKGPNSCRNYGLELSKGEFVKWFDSDDLMYSELLEEQIASFKSTTDCSVCKIVYCDFEKNITIKENTIYSSQLIEDYLVGRITFYVSGPLWRKRFLNDQKELFDENLSNLDDWDFNLRMLYKNPKVVFIDRPLIKYRVHENSLSNEIGKLNVKEIKSEFNAREKHLKLIRSNNKANFKILQNSNLEQYRFILREAMVTNNKNKKYFFKHLFLKQLEAFVVKQAFRTFIVFFIYRVFKKGYRFL